VATKILEAFSLSHAAILDGTTGAEATNGDIYGVNEASLDPDSDSYDNEGDDVVMSSWNWLNFATVNVQGGYLPFDLIALITGTTVTSTGVAPADEHAIDLWHESSMAVGPKPMLVRMPARDSNGVARNLDIVLYKVQFEPITFDGPAYKDGLKVNYNGKALMSAVDEVGDVFPDGKKRVGRLVNRPPQ